MNRSMNVNILRNIIGMIDQAVLSVPTSSLRDVLTVAAILATDACSKEGTLDINRSDNDEANAWMEAAERASAKRRDFTLDELQTMMGKWRAQNFPNTPETQNNECVMGVSEEAGELIRSHLKSLQSIRGFSTMGEGKVKRDYKMKDAMADGIIYMMGVCDANEWRLQNVLETTCQSVMERDWISDPDEGGQS